MAKPKIVSYIETCTRCGNRFSLRQERVTGPWTCPECAAPYGRTYRAPRFVERAKGGRKK